MLRSLTYSKIVPLSLLEQEKCASLNISIFHKLCQHGECGKTIDL